MSMSVGLEKELDYPEMNISYQLIGDNLRKLDWESSSLSQSEIETLFAQVFWTSIQRFDFGYAEKLCQSCPQVDFVEAFRYIVQVCRETLRNNGDVTCALLAVEGASRTAYVKNNPGLNDALSRVGSLLSQVIGSAQP